MAGAPNEVQPDELLLALQKQQQATFEVVSLDPRCCPDLGVKLCAYRPWFCWPTDRICPGLWEVPMSTAMLQSFRMGSQFCRAALCIYLATGVSASSVTLGLQVSNERQMLLQCPVLADFRQEGRKESHSSLAAN